jgi:mannitol-specific phosphotransferase system IIBC component
MMKILAAVCILLLPAAVLAQYPQNMNEMDVQKMMQQAQAMQACMQQVDQAALQKFQQRAMEVNEEIKSLCAAGKRDKAQKVAMNFGREAEKNQAVQEMKKCGELAKDMMPMQMMPDTHEELDYSTQHVCDNLGE